MSSIDTFVMRRMQHAAMSKWTTPTKATTEPDTTTGTAPSTGSSEPQSPGLHLADLEQLDESVHQMLRDLDEDVVRQLQDSLTQLGLDDSLTEHGDEPEEEQEEEQPVPAEPKPTTPPSSTYCEGRGRPHVGPRQWNQRPVFHDVLSCDLLDDDDDDFFGDIAKNKVLRSTKAATPTTSKPTKTKKNKKRTTPKGKTLASVSAIQAPRTRSLSPTPDRRHKVMSLAA